MGEGCERLPDARPGFVMPAGPGIGIGSEAEMEGFDPAGTHLVRLAQASLDLVEARCRALLRQGPAEMDLRKSMPEGERILFGKAQRFARGAFDPVRTTQPHVRDVDPVTQDEAGRVGVV